MDEKTITRERVVATRSRVGIASLASVIEFPIIGSLRVVKKTIEDVSLLSRRLFAWSGRARLPPLTGGTSCAVGRRTTTVTWLILPVVICLSQRLSHACLSISNYTVKLRMAH